MEAALELCEFVAALLQTLLAFEERWRKERAELLLQMLCVSHRCLVINGDCRPLLSLMQQLLPHCRHVRCYMHIGLFFLDSFTKTEESNHHQRSILF